MNYTIAPWIEKDRKNIYDHKHVTREKRWRSWHFCKKNQQRDDNACLHKPKKKNIDHPLNQSKSSNQWWEMQD